MAIALIAGLVGVAGTVIGGLLAMWTARRSEDRAEERARKAAMREELKGALTGCCSTIANLQAAGLDRWAPAPGELDAAEIRERAYRYYLARAEATAARFRLELATGDKEVTTNLLKAFKLVDDNDDGMRAVARGEALKEQIKAIRLAVEAAVKRGRELLGVEGTG